MTYNEMDRPVSPMGRATSEHRQNLNRETI